MVNNDLKLASFIVKESTVLNFVLGKAQESLNFDIRSLCDATFEQINSSQKINGLNVKEKNRFSALLRNEDFKERVVVKVAKNAVSELLSQDKTINEIKKPNRKKYKIRATEYLKNKDTKDFLKKIQEVANKNISNLIISALKQVEQDKKNHRQAKRCGIWGWPALICLLPVFGPIIYLIQGIVQSIFTKEKTLENEKWYREKYKTKKTFVSDVSTPQTPKTSKEVSKKKKPSKKKLTNKNCGADWLTLEIQKKGYSDTPSYSAFSIVSVKKFQEKKESLSELFPKRTITESDVAGLRSEEINKLEDSIFFSIIDLLSIGQIKDVFTNPNVSGTKKFAILHLLQGKADEAQLQILEDRFEEEINRLTIQKCHEVYEKFSKLQLEQTTIDKAVDQQTALSPTHIHNDYQGHKKTDWKNVNKKVQLYAKQEKIDLTIEKVKEWYRELMQNGGSRSFDFRGEDAQFAGQDYISSGNFSDTKKYDQFTLFYLTPRKVKPTMEKTIKWLNEEIEKCDKKERNPISLAAEVYRGFVSIHPFDDGNGRISRLISNLVLYRFDLLPPDHNCSQDSKYQDVCNIKGFPIYNIPTFTFLPKDASPSLKEVVKSFVEGVEMRMTQRNFS